jgi:uncharacterized repeat protein (TIGR03803 family)
MRCKGISPAAALALLIITFSVGSPTFVSAQTFKILHTFGAPGDGAAPIGGLVMDAGGNLYGQTEAGGILGNFQVCFPPGCGTVYKLSPNSDGTWAETVLHSFSVTDGIGGSFSSPIIESHGNLLGTAQHSIPGGGAVFELTPAANGSWNFSVLHTFNPVSNGYAPYGVILRNGSLFGTTTEGGGGDNQGVVFQMTQVIPNRWSENTLYVFSVDGGGDYNPDGVIFDAAGNLYGTNASGGTYGKGSVYKMTRDPHTGQWTKTTLYEFSGADGATPLATLVFDAAGNLYSTTNSGGASGHGTVFELTPHSDGSWTEQVLYSFQFPENPIAGVVTDQQGNLYGVTGGNGLVFELSPAANGQWSYTLLHQFSGADGQSPFGLLLRDSAGNLYGTTSAGGTLGKGVVFEITQ